MYVWLAPVHLELGRVEARRAGLVDELVDAGDLQGGRLGSPTEVNRRYSRGMSEEMKLAEALALRADAAKRIEQLRTRVV
ncbi:hypothetical protein AB0383_49725, partial [Amycolatopsis sp. NPDC051373]|uniref:hypothetical protein n=1 Tax=Amycolatopsis sp. NPDC051373 TaxID=3155801 RepID=UPI0034502863